MDRRIRVSKEVGNLVERLTRSDEYPNGPFRQRSDVLTFAAAYGYRHGRRSAFSETLDPVRLEVFERQGHDIVMYLLALADTKDALVLSRNDEAVERRATVFEEYANGGLELLRSELSGLDDPLEKLLLLVGAERQPGDDATTEELNLTRLLG